MVDSRIDVNQKMSRLVDRFFECKVVPFIGAGVSKNALCKSGNGQIGDTGKMIGAIAKKLLNLMEKDHEPNQWLRWCCSFLECGEENNQSNCGKRGCLLKQLSGNTNTDKYLRKYMTLDKLCEMYTWVAGKDAQRSLVKDVLKIQKFSELTPTAAHNAITGADAKKLGATEDKEHLTADLFWKRVYQAAFWQLLKKYCNHDTPIYAYLSSCIYPVEALLSGFKSWLVPPEKPCGRFPELLEMDNDLQVTVLTRWIHCIRYGETHCSKGIYLPLIEKPVLLPLVMLILYLTAGNQESWEEINRIVDAGNHLFILNIIENLPVILFHDTSVFNKALKNAGAMLRNVNIGIIVSCKLEEEAGIIHQRFDLPGTGKNQDLPVKKDVTIYKIPFKELFCRDGDMPRSVDALRDQFFASLRMPKLIAAKARPKLRNRVRKIS